MVSHEPKEAINMGTVTWGNNDDRANQNDSAKINIEDLGQHVRVRIGAKIRGEGGFGRPGRFKAIYLLRWQ